MGIENTLSSIKTYFFNWHRDNYNTLHNITDNITNQSPDNEKLVKSEAIYNCTKGIKQDLSNYQTITDGKITCLNNAKNDIYSQLKEASFGTIPNVINEYDTYFDGDSRGFHFPNLDETATKGFMTPEEKADLHYAIRWFEITGEKIGKRTSITKHMTMWINLGLRLVYLNFSYKGCPWLKNQYRTTGQKYFFGNPNSGPNEVWIQVRPIKTVWAPTNYDNIRIGVETDGTFHIRPTTAIKKNVDITGSLMWYYRDGPPSKQMGRWG